MLTNESIFAGMQPGTHNLLRVKHIIMREISRRDYFIHLEKVCLYLKALTSLVDSESGQRGCTNFVVTTAN